MDAVEQIGINTNTAIEVFSTDDTSEDNNWSGHNNYNNDELGIMNNNSDSEYSSKTEGIMMGKHIS